MASNRTRYDEDFGNQQTVLLIQGDNVTVTDRLAARYMTGYCPATHSGFVDLIFASPPRVMEGMSDTAYQDWQISLLWHLHRIMNPHSSLFYHHHIPVDCDFRNHPISWLSESRLAFKQELIWDQTIAESNRTDIFHPCDERIFWLYKVGVTPSPSGGVVGGEPSRGATITTPTVISATRIHTDLHPEPFPRSVVNAVLKPLLSPGRFPDRRAMVMDPYVGSATTGMVALAYGANFIGVDINEEYLDIAEERIRSSFPNTRIMRWDFTQPEESDKE